MSDPVINLALVGRLIRHRWPLLVAVAVLGALLGSASSFVLSPGYVATGKILLNGERDEKQLPGEAQIATSRVVVDKTAESLGDGERGSDLQGRITASVDGNVISISGAATTPEKAQQLAVKATEQYIAFSGQIVSDTAAATAEVSKKSRDAVQKRIDDANERITQLQASPAIASAGSDGVAARSELDQEKVTVTSASKDLEQIDSTAETASLAASLGRSTTRIIEPPILPEGPASPTLLELIVGGAALAIALAVFAHLVALRSDRRLRESSDVAAALGAPVLGQFEVSDLRARPSLLRRLLHDERGWLRPETAVADDGRNRTARGERILRRLPGDAGSPPDLLVLTFDDDEAALAVVSALAVSAAGHGPVTVVTADDGVAARVQAAATADELAGSVSVHPREGPANTTVLRPASVAVARPVVPDVGASSTVVLAMTAGTRTGWELASLVGACIDAGQVVAGCVLVTLAGRAGGAGKPADVGAVLDGAALAGSS